VDKLVNKYISRKGDPASGGNEIINPSKMQMQYVPKGLCDTRMLGQQIRFGILEQQLQSTAAHRCETTSC
jgi:hypothetical protein